MSAIVNCVAYTDGHRIGDVARAGLPGEVGMGQRRELNLRHRVIDEERLPVADAALHELHGLVGGLAIDGPARHHVERLDVARRRSGRVSRRRAPTAGRTPGCAGSTR